MIDFKGMIENEELSDALSFLVLKKSYPIIDNLFVRYKFEVVEKAELYQEYRKLLDNGFFIEDDKGHARKGPNWKEPAFVTQNKYGIE